MTRIGKILTAVAVAAMAATAVPLHGQAPRAGAAPIDGPLAASTFAACDPGAASRAASDGAIAAAVNPTLTAKMRNLLSAYRVSCARRIVETTQARDLEPRAAVIAVTTAIVESGLQNYSVAEDHDSLGLFQQRPSAGWGTPAQIIDPAYATGRFLSKMESSFPDGAWRTADIGAVCQRVQGSAFPGRYGPQAGDAQKIVDALWNPTYVSVAGGRAYEYQGQQHVLGWSTTNRVTSYWYEPGRGWATPDVLPGPAVAGQAVGISALGQQQVFVRSPGGTLWHWWYTPGGAGWQNGDLGHTVRGTPATCAYRTGRGEQVHAFGSTATGRLGHWWFEPGGAGWRYDELPAGSAASGPTCVSWRNQLHVFARSTAGALEHWWYVPGSGWRNGPLGGALTGDPDATTYAPAGTDQVVVFARSPSGSLVQWWYEEGAGWRTGDLGGSFVGTPAAGTVRDVQPSQLQVFGRTAAGALHHWFYAPGRGWQQSDDGTAVGGDPALLVYTYPAPDQQQVFAKSTAGTRLTDYRYLPGTGWVQSDLGGSVAL